VLQRFPAFPVVHSDRSDGHLDGDVAPPVIGSMKPQRNVSAQELVPLAGSHHAVSIAGSATYPRTVSVAARHVNASSPDGPGR
jgi:hypothetical protein